MTTTGLPEAHASFDARPLVRRDLLVSDKVLHGARSVRLVRDPVLDRTFELGPREHFVLARLDGRRSLAEVGEEYAAEFGRTLDARAWHTLLSLYGSRGLLQGAPIQQPVRPATRMVRGTVLAGEASFVKNPERLAAGLVRRGRPLLFGAGPVVLLLCAALVPVLVLVDSGRMIDRAGDGFPSWPTLLGVAVLLWISTALHELGHAVLAHRYGGRVTDLGVKWRLPMLMPFCRVSDYQFLPHRRARTATALAGVVTNLLFLSPAAVCWMTGVGDAAFESFLATLLLAGTVVALANLVPLPPLDGYVILSHALGVVQLTAQSQAYLSTLIRSRARRETTSRYPQRARRIYLAYGVLAPSLVLLLVGGAVLLTALLMPSEAGSWRYAAPLLVAVLALAGLATAGRTRSS